MTGQVALDPALVERFGRDWYALTRSGCADRALLAVSGGPDSIALLLLFAARKGFVNPPIVATVDHGLRERSAAEAAAVADLCRRVGLEHVTLSGMLPPRVDGTANLSARARSLRYALLQRYAEEAGARWIVTAHHADDQLETMVMRLNRGSGVGGLAAIRSVTDKIVRPLLGWRHAELEAIVATAGIGAAADPSNTDDRFDRARLRKLLAGADWLDPRAASRSAAALADADEAIEWMLDELETQRCQFGEGQAILDHLFLPRELQRRLVGRCLRHVEPAIVVRGGDLTRLLTTLLADRPATLGDVKVDHRVLAGPLPRFAWTFQKAPPRRSG